MIAQTSEAEPQRITLAEALSCLNNVEQAVLLYLRSATLKSSSVTIGAGEIAERTGFSHSAVKTALRRMAKDRIIECVQAGTSRYTPSTWRLLIENPRRPGERPRGIAEIVHQAKREGEAQQGPTISDAYAQYLAWYRATHKPGSGGLDTEANAMKWLTRLRPPDAAETTIGAMSLDAINRRLLRHVRDEMDGSGKLARKSLNCYLRAMKRFIGWCYEHDLIDEQAPGPALAMNVPTLRRGRSRSPDHPPIVSPPPGDVDRFIAQARDPMATMVHVQRWTGMRSANLCAMRLAEIDRSRDIWLYRPADHKTAHHGLQLLIPIGPAAQRALSPWIEAPASVRGPGKRADWLFLSPRTRRPYSRAGYRVAIQREMQRLSIPLFTPHQLRHAYATDVAARCGRDAAQILLGHSSPTITERYIDPTKAEQIVDLARTYG